MTTNVMAPSATKSEITSLTGALKPLSRWAEENGVTRATCWRWRRDGLISTFDIYGRQYITREEEERFFRRAVSGEFHRDPRTPSVARNSEEV